MKKFLKKIIGVFYYNFFVKYKNTVGNRILLYHSIGTKLDFDTYGISISKERFLEHLIFLKDNYEIIAINNQYCSKLDRDTISITLDDGYKDNMYVFELCEKYNIPFTLYITTGFIGKKDYLDEDDIKKLSKSEVCTLGTHGVTHTHLDKLNYDEQYYELENSKKTLESIVGYEIVHMSFPHGSFDNNTFDIIDKLGYLYIGSSIVGKNSKKNIDLRKLKRIEVIAGDNLIDLKRKILGYYDFKIRT